MELRPHPRRHRSLEESVLFVTLFLGSALIAVALLGSVLFLGLSVTSYIAVHNILEMGSVLVSFSIFIVNWEASKQSRNSQSLFIATGFLTVAGVDLMHILSLHGMPAFVTPNGMDKSIYYWLFARLWGALVLLAAVFVSPDSRSRFLSRFSLTAINIFACLVAFVAVTYFQDSLPTMFVEGMGLTNTTVVIEMAAIGFTLVAAALYARRYNATGDWGLALLVTGLVVAVFSEISISLFHEPEDIYNIVGHGYKVVAYYLIFRALLVSSVERPYIQLREAKAELEHTVSELHERTRELDALDEVALTLSSSLKPDELLSSAVEKVMAVMQAKGGAIFLIDEETGEITLTSWRGLPGPAVAHLQADFGHFYRPRPTTDTSTAGETLDPFATGLGGSSARVAPLRRCVCAPVTTKGRVLGSIAMIGDEVHSFRPSDADLLTAVGYQLGLAIENARLYGRTDEQLRQKLREIELAERKSRFLAEASALLAGSMDLGMVLDLVARKASEVVGDWCAIYLLDDDRGRALRLAAVYHEDQDELVAIRDILSRRLVPLDEGILGAVVETSEALIVSGESLHQFGWMLESLAEEADEIAMVRRVLPSSAVVAPMRARGKTLGVLVVMETHTSASMEEPELALVRELGNRAGVAVQNSRLYEESQSQRRQIEATISQMVDGVVIADADGEIVVANAAARSMLGTQLNDLAARAPSSTVEEVGGFVPATPPLVTQALRGTPLVGEEFQVACDPTERVLSASATAVRSETGEVSGAVVVLRDVTAEREIDRMKDEFVATVSHELRTPITAVLGYTDLLLRGVRGPLLPPQHDALTSVRNAGHRLLALIEDLLDMSKLEAGKQELNLEEVALPAAIGRAVSGVALMAGSRGVRLVQSIPADLPRVVADDLQLQRILGNLLSNALKFTPDGGAVSISAAIGADEAGTRGVATVVNVQVRDTGVGIPRDKQEKIWEKFEQADSSSRRAFGGTGLGLAIVKALVELHGGTVWVESEGIPGKGSTFGFSMPVAGCDAN